MLSPADHERIAAAVARAEAGTSGEILCVLAKQVSDYRETPLAWAAGVALLAPPLLVMAGLHPLIAAQPGGGWLAGGQGALRAAVDLALTGYALMQIIVFSLIAVLVASLAPVKSALTPRSLKRRRVHQAAMRQLLAVRLLGSGVGAAVVIFASEADRMVAVVADEAIHVKVGDSVWDAAVAAVLDGIRRGDSAAGFVAAVDLCGGVLAEHFPTHGDERHGLTNELIEL